MSMLGSRITTLEQEIALLRAENDRLARRNGADRRTAPMTKRVTNEDLERAVAAHAADPGATVKDGLRAALKALGIEVEPSWAVVLRSVVDGWVEGVQENAESMGKTPPGDNEIMFAREDVYHMIDDAVREHASATRAEETKR